jgi:ligand-binding SRPBCC domain-containing protein
MPIIKLSTNIKADIQIVFDLSRSIDLHTISTDKTNEEAIAGVTTGLIGLNETVTWRAKHLGVTQILQSKITSFKPPYYFVDEMLKGTFKSLHHEHHFEMSNKETIMTDVFTYKSPLGILGRLADVLFLRNYLTKFILERNQIVKEFAESDRWKEVLF